MIVLAVFALIYIVEVFHDNVLKELNKGSDPELSKKWHRLDWLSQALIAVLTGYLVSTGSEFVVQKWIIVALYAVALGSLRVLILNIGLNILCKTCKWNHLGKNFIDNLFRKVPTFYYIAVLLVFITSTYLIIRL